MAKLRTILVLLVGVPLAHGTPLAALALEPPGGPEITSALAGDLPAYWSIQSVEITASVNEGDDVTPRFRQRFVADAVSKEDLYLSVSDDAHIGPFTMLITTHAATQTRKIYGIATSSVSLGKWAIELSLENSVVGVGLPQSLYAGPVVVAGAERTGETAQEFLKLHEISRTVTEGMVRRTASTEALEKLAEEEQAALEEANRRRRAALEEKYRQELVAFMAGVESERQQLEAANKVRLARVKAELEEEIAALERRKAAVEQERKLLVEESQRILDELARKHREERAAFAVALEREHQQHRETNRKRLNALKAELQEENARVDETTAALDNERKLLVAEHQRNLDALRAQHERKRAEISAVRETLDAIARAETETAAQKKLAAAQAALAEETKRAIEVARQARDVMMQERKTRYDALATALGSENVVEQNTAFDAILESDDEHLKKTAIAAAMKSGDDGLQAKALAALIVKSPRIGVTLKDKKGRVKANQYLEVTSVDPVNLSFSGRFQPSVNNICTTKQYAPKGSGSVSRDSLTLSGSWFRSNRIGASGDSVCNHLQRASCTTNARVDDKGVLSGITTCGDKEYTAEVNL